MKAQKQMKKVIAIACAALGLAAVAAPKVKIDKIENTSVWSTKKVTYTVSDVPATDGAYAYTLAFDVTAYGVTTNINKGTAQNGTFTETLDTAAIFGETRKDPNAKIRVSVETTKGVQLWENGPYFARCNVGANEPHENGYYFWWGDTVGYKRNGSQWDAADGSKTGFQFTIGNCPTYDRSNDWLMQNGWIGEDGNLVAAHDAATAHRGAPWRMMTLAELEKLCDTSYCTRTWVTSYNGKSVSGYVVKGAKDPYKNNEVFFPAAGGAFDNSQKEYGGRYWTSTPNPDGEDCDFEWGWILLFYGPEMDYFFHTYCNCDRCEGLSVRPVRDLPPEDDFDWDEKTFWLMPDEQVVLKSLSTTAITYGEKLSASTVSGEAHLDPYVDAPVEGAEVPGTFAWTDGDAIYPTVADSQKTAYEVIFTPDNDDYDPVKTKLTLTINKKSLSITGMTASEKMYDGTTAATVSGGALDGVINSDAVTATMPTVGVFADANVGSGKTVTIEPPELIGSAAGNYSLTAQPELKANITNRCVTLTSGTQQWTYDGNAHSNVAVAVGGDGFVAGEGVTTNGFVTITDVGSKLNVFSYAFRTGTLVANYAVTCVTGTLTVVKGDLPPGDDPDPTDPTVDPDDPGQREGPTIPFSAFDYVGMYDGEAHTIDTNALKATWTAAMGAGVACMYARARDGEWTAEPVTLKDVGVASFWYKVTSANYADIVKPCKVAVTNRCVTLTSGTESFVYDGNAHSNMTVAVGGDGFVADEGVTTNSFAIIKEKGSVPNAFSYAFLPNTLAANYVITCVTGTLSVVNVLNSWIVEPAVTSKTYDGTPAAVVAGTPKFGSVLVTYDDGDPGAPVAAGRHTATFSVAATSDYGSLLKTVAYTIFKASIPGYDPGPIPPGVDPDDPAQKEDPNIPFSAFDYVGMYDGGAHTVDTNALKQAWTAALGAVTVGYSAASNGAYQATAFAFKDSAVTSFWYKVTSANYADVIRPCKVVITNRCVTLTSGTQEWTYDGNAHSDTTVAVGGDGFVRGEGAETFGFSTITDVGSVPNAFSYAFQSGTLAANYAVNCVTGTLTVVQGEDPAPPMLDPSAWGKVKYPKPAKGSAYLKPNATATWKATPEQACVFTGWEWTNGAPEAAFLALSENERRNKSLKVKVVGMQVKPTDVGATWARIDEDRIQSVELTSGGLDVVCKSYVTASVGGLPRGLKFNKRTLAITGTAKKDGAKAVKVSVKNASGYTWKESWLVTTSGGKVTRIEPVPGSRVMAGEPVMLWGAPAFGKVKGSKVYAVGKKASIKATPAKGSIFLGWYDDAEFTRLADWLPKGPRKASQSVVVTGELHLFARFVELKPWAVGTFNGGSDEEGGLVTLTIGKTSKVSGKFLTNGKTWKLSAAAFTDHAETNGVEVFFTTLTAKCGKEEMTVEVEVTAAGVVGRYCASTRDASGTVLFEAYRNGWKEEPLKTVAKALKGEKVSVAAPRSEDAAGTVLLTVGANGAVKAKGTFDGYSASCSTVLIPTETANEYLVYVYFPPKAGKFDGFSGSYVIRL